MACVVVLRAADESNGLTLSVDAVRMDPSNNKSLTILLHIVNTSDHEITVLTKGLDFVASNDDGAKTYECRIGYTGSLTHEGHLVVPSLSDLGPVTLKPNEEAGASYEMDEDSDAAKLIKSKIPIEVSYCISDLWAKRLGLWGGTVKAPPASIMPFGAAK